ncbi:MAG: hypothetical protein GWO38_10250 [Phycisphaerae bacterium]|nr:hypothetical protein [Phycisphaerae bacterium]NIX27991.1 hypothetical protein [Phycisphaerae bacterium]
MTDFNPMLAHWRQNPAEFSSAAWQTFIRPRSPLPFTPARLEVERDLWGSFWQGDVIAPGYKLPALELAYLRATRLDETFTDPTPQSYLQNLQTTLLQFPSGAWLAQFSRISAVCVAFEADALHLIIWLVDGFIVAGYKDLLTDSPGYKLGPLHPLTPASSKKTPLRNQQNQLPHQRLAEWSREWPELDQATQIDRLIQAHRAYSYAVDQRIREKIGRWLTQHS